jgi:hypothetical protein
MGATAEVRRKDVPNMADITPRQGLTCCLFGRWTLSFETDWRRMGFSCVDAPFGGMVGVELSMRKADEKQRWPSRPH